jgi:cytochrome P450
LIAVAEQRFDYWNKWAALPGLEWLLAKSTTAQLQRRPDRAVALVSRKKMMSRGKEKREQPMKGGSADLLQKLLDSQAKHPGCLSDDDILGVVMSIMSAGADTTATTFVAIFHLMKYPKVLAKLIVVVGDETTASMITFLFYHPAREPGLLERLREEISALTDDGGEIEHRKLQGATLLNACIFEALRLHPAVPSGL